MHDHRSNPDATPAERQRDLLQYLAFHDRASLIAGVDREAVVALAEGLYKIANCHGCPSCQSIAREALGSDLPDDTFLDRWAVFSYGRSEHHERCRYFGDGRIECHPDCSLALTDPRSIHV